MSTPPNQINAVQMVHINGSAQPIIASSQLHLLNHQQQTALRTLVSSCDRLWRFYQAHLNNGTANHVIVTPAHYNIVGDSGLKIISSRYSNMISAPVKMVRDAFGNILIQPLPLDSLGRKSISEKGPSTSKLSDVNEGKNWRGKLPRPPNSFILYRQHHHPIVKAENPGFHNNQISLILGKQWRNESEEVKNEFKALAEKLKKQHFLDHPDYQYQPRKPSEKKRRMTRHKAESLALNEKSSSPTILEDASAVLQRIDNDLDVVSEQPQFETTRNGNIILNLGDEDLDSSTLTSMLESSNEGLPQTNVLQHHRWAHMGTAALYSEPHQGSQDDYNFYSGINDSNLQYECTPAPNQEPTRIQSQMSENQNQMQQYADEYEETFTELMNKYTYSNEDFTTFDENGMFDF